MSYYLGLVIISCMTALVMIAVIAFNDRLPRSKKIGFIVSYILLIVATVAEWGVLAMDGTPVRFRLAHGLLKVLEFSLTPTVMMLWINTMNGFRNIRLLVGMGAFNFVLQGSSLLTRYIFYIDENNVYHHGDFYWIYIVIYIFTMLVLLTECIRFSRKYQNQNLAVIVCISAFSCLGIAIHFFNPDIRLDWMVATISFSFMYIYYNALIEQVDSLTHMLGRQSYEIYIANLKKHAIVLIFDVDDFKTINDRYGHDVGDDCLVDVAAVILNTYRRYGLCFRVGGDEFCAILTKNIESMEELNGVFREEILEMRKANEERYPFPDISVGYSVYTPGVNIIGDVVKEADTKMYLKKKERKNAESMNERKGDRM